MGMFDWLLGKKTQEWYINKLDKLTKERLAIREQQQKLRSYLKKDSNDKYPEIVIMGIKLHDTLTKIDTLIKEYLDEVVGKGFKIPAEIVLRLSQ